MNAARSTEWKDRKRLNAERLLAVLVRDGLESPLESADPAYWHKRRQALRRAITKNRVER
jgi:hypothetical protein